MPPEAMCSRGYGEAVAQLNMLQSNAVIDQPLITVINQPVRERQSQTPLVYPRMAGYLKSAGIEQEHLTSLRAIHVSGTKGKGSTCAFVDSILRSYGYKTGFYSSPHLVEVRERIRIGGKPISKDLFAKHFWETFDLLRDHEKNTGVEVPAYFAFLTVMALRLFVLEGVHVSVIEVGLGGQYDSTNIVDQPCAVGITSLALDHVRSLGDTIEKIAWHKAGIMKFRVPAFTVNQPPAAMEVLQERSAERKCNLYTVPSLHLYDTGGGIVNLGIGGKVQLENASLAVQMAHYWIKKYDSAKFAKVDCGLVPEEAYAESYITPVRSFYLPEETINGLVSCRWPGRCQRLRVDNITYFLDGAHTLESMDECSQWFQGEMSKDNGTSKPLKVLVFHCMGDRNATALLSSLAEDNFDIAIFTPNLIQTRAFLSSDNSNFTVDSGKERMKCEAHLDIWRNLNSSREDRNGMKNHVVGCVADAVEDVKRLSSEDSSREVAVLVSGSIHLVGNMLSVIDPDLPFL